MNRMTKISPIKNDSLHTELTFITGNQHKADYLAQWLGVPVAHHRLDLDELQSLDVREVVAHKARQAYEALKRPVLVEDATLTFPAMGRLPGTYIKWFIQELGVEGVGKLANRLEHQQAVGLVCYALYDGKDMHFFEGEMRGVIAATPRGQGGFGFDAIFINEGQTKTRAELDEDTYVATSYRTTAIKKLQEFLGHGQAV